MSSDKKGMSRRQWLRNMGLTGLGALLLPAEPSAHGRAAAGDMSLAKANVKVVMPTRLFGKTGVRVSALALGGMFDIPSNQLMLKQALRWGITYWDTADCYLDGKSEEGIGKFFSSEPKERKNVFLVTKSDVRDSSGLTRLLEQSLHRMKTDYIDLYLLHGISSISELDSHTEQWAKQAKAAKKIKFFGFSTHKNMEDCMLEGAKLAWIDGIMMKYDFRIMNNEKMKNAVAACAKAGIGLTAMKTQGGNSTQAESEAELKLIDRFVKQGFTDKQARLKIVWETPQIASICSQMPNLTVLMSNVAAAADKTKLSSLDHELLAEYARETCTSYCAGCGNICEAAISDRVPVSDIMRYLMYFHSYKEPDMARSFFRSLDPQVRAGLLNVDYSPAERGCPQRLKIAQLMKSAVELLA